MQVGQEADTALGIGAAEPGEGRTADDGDVAVPALVAGAGVVDRDGRTDRQARLEQAGLLGQEGLLTRRQQSVDLADGKVEAPFKQLLVQLRLRNVAVVVLVQNEGAQARAEMPSAQLRRAGRREYAAILSRPAFEQEAGIVRADAQVLHREAAVAQKARPFRHIVDCHRAFFMNVEAGGLCRLARIVPFATPFAAARVILVRLLVHPARLHRRPTLLTLEHGNLVPHPPNGFGLLQHLFLQFGVLGSKMIQTRDQRPQPRQPFLRQRRRQLKWGFGWRRKHVANLSTDISYLHGEVPPLSEKLHAFRVRRHCRSRSLSRANPYSHMAVP